MNVKSLKKPLFCWIYMYYVYLCELCRVRVCVRSVSMILKRDCVLYILKFYFLSANERSVVVSKYALFAGYFCTMSIKLKLKIQGAKLYQNINDEGETVSHPKKNLLPTSQQVWSSALNTTRKKNLYYTTGFYFISR